MSINKWNPYGPSSEGIVGHGPETPEMPTCSYYVQDRGAVAVHRALEERVADVDGINDDEDLGKVD